MPRPTPQNTTPAALTAVGEAILKSRPLLRRTCKITDAELEARITERLDIIAHYLTPEIFLGKLAASPLQHIGIYEGILTDKLLALKGVPNMIVSHQEHRKLDQLAPALLAEMTRRGLTARDEPAAGYVPQVTDARFVEITEAVADARP